MLVFHAASVPGHYAGIATPPWLASLNNVLSAYRMPLLMLLSGFMLGRSLEKPLAVFFSGKVRGLLWPYLMWAVIVLAVTGHLGQVLDVGSWIPVTYIWFLLFVFLYYCAAPLLTRVPAPLIVLVAHAGAYMVEERGFISKFILFSGYFYLGHYLAHHHHVLRGRYRLAAAALLVASVAVNISPLHSTLVGYAVTLSGIVGVVALAWTPSLESGLRSTNLLDPVFILGRNSIIFYLSHYPVMVLLSYGLAAIGVEGAAVMAWALCLSVSLVVGVVLVRLQDIPVVKLLFVGPRIRPAKVRN